MTAAGQATAAEQKRNKKLASCPEFGNGKNSGQRKILWQEINEHAVDNRGHFCL
jgi:hypothetical protein